MVFFFPSLFSDFRYVLLKTAEKATIRYISSSQLNCGFGLFLHPTSSQESPTVVGEGRRSANFRYFIGLDRFDSMIIKYISEFTLV